jgi:hypothetical protein
MKMQEGGQEREEAGRKMEDGRNADFVPHSSFLIPPSSPRVLLTQPPKDNLLVNPVDELGPEPRLDFGRK